jgi:CD2 antigen cytoplasmic tail-binding protein 2
MSRPHPRAKRAGEDFTRTHHNDDDEADGPSSSKKPRFDLRNPSTLAPDALEDDAILDADVIGRRGQQVRRNAVNIDGYDSDSENEGFDARVEAKAKANREAEGAGDDEDMFAELKEDFAEEAEADAAPKKNEKRVRFLQPEDIEGQDLNTRDGNGKSSIGNDEDSRSDSEVEEEERAKPGEVDEELGAGAKKSHAPLLDAFNMQAEQQEGRFDDQGNFIRKAVDPDAVHDMWLEGVSRNDMKKAREAAEKRDEERRQKDRADDSVLTSDVLKTLIPYLERGETILEALARLGKGQGRKPKWQNKNKGKNKHKLKNGAEDVEMAEEESPEIAARKRAIETITEAADILLTRGQAEVYDAERDLLVRQYRRETGEEWVEPQSSTTVPGGEQKQTAWEYRWSDARDGGETHGPYEGTMMESWNNAGYFGDGVEFRRAGDSGPWSKAVDFSK